MLFAINWDLFTTFVEVDLGFAFFKTLPFLILQIFGLLILSVFAILDNMKDLKREVKITELHSKIIQLQKDAEISSLKQNQENIKNKQLDKSIISAK